MNRLNLILAVTSLLFVSTAIAQDPVEQRESGQAADERVNPGQSVLESQQDEERAASQIPSVLDEQPSQPMQRRDPDRVARFGTVLSEAGSGVFISSVYTNSPAQRIGLQTGDRIVSINGNPISASIHVHQILKELEPGASISVVFQHRGAEFSRDIALVSHSELMRVSNINYRGDSNTEPQTVFRPPYRDINDATESEIEERIGVLEDELKLLRERLQEMRSNQSQSPSESNKDSSSEAESQDQGDEDGEQPESSENDPDTA